VLNDYFVMRLTIYLMRHASHWLGQAMLVEKKVEILSCGEVPDD
jgi:hypothetical protein